MEKQNKVDLTTIVKEVAEISGQSRDVVRLTLQAYNNIIIREVANDSHVFLGSFMSLRKKYRKSGLVGKFTGKRVGGSNVVSVTISDVFKRIINSTEKADIKIEPFEGYYTKVVKDLKQKIKSLNMTICHERNKLNTAKRKCKERIENIYKRNKELSRRRHLKKVSMSAIQRKANGLLTNKIVRSRVNSDYYLDAITSYPVLTEFYKTQNMTMKQLNMFIIINHFRYFELKDAELFGFTRSSASNALNVLHDNGLVEKFKSRGVRYSVSLTGKKRFKEFATHINKKMRILLNSYKERFEDTELDIPIKTKI